MVNAAGILMPGVAPVTSENETVRTITKNVIDYGTPVGLMMKGAGMVNELFGGTAGKSLGDIALGAGDVVREGTNEISAFLVDHSLPGQMVRGANFVTELTGGRAGQSLGEAIFKS